MIITIGEKLNSSIPSAMSALCGDDSEILKLILIQEKADYIDINTAMCEDETSQMRRCVRLVAENTNCGVCIDALDADVILAGLAAAEERKIIINSINPANFEKVVPVVKDRQDVCLIIHSKETKTIEQALGLGISAGRLLLDISLTTLATDSSSGISALNKITELKNKYNAGIVCGLSNLSFGLPGRQKLNAVFLAFAIEKGLTAAILDVTNDEIWNIIYSSNLILGDDEYCMEYISYVRGTTIQK